MMGAGEQGWELPDGRANHLHPSLLKPLPWIFQKSKSLATRTSPATSRVALYGNEEDIPATRDVRYLWEIPHFFPVLYSEHQSGSMAILCCPCATWLHTGHLAHLLLDSPPSLALMSVSQSTDLSAKDGSHTPQQQTLEKSLGMPTGILGSETREKLKRLCTFLSFGSYLLW